MSFTDSGNGNGFFMPVGPAYSGGGSGWGNSFGGDGAWWLLVLILAMNGGWGNGFGNNNVAPYVIGNSTNADIQRGFDQQAITSGINSLSSEVTTGFSNAQQSLRNGFAGTNATITGGFANAETAANARQMANMQQGFGIQSAISQLGATVLSEGCNDRNTVNMGVRDIVAGGTANTQRIVDVANDGFRNLYDKLCQMDTDNIKRDYENRIATLENQLATERTINQNARFDASQNNQTSVIQAGQRALANEVEQYISPNPRPAYVVPNPYCNCGNFTSGCCN